MRIAPLALALCACAPVGHEHAQQPPAPVAERGVRAPAPAPAALDCARSNQPPRVDGISGITTPMRTRTHPGVDYTLHLLLVNFQSQVRATNPPPNP